MKFSEEGWPQPIGARLRGAGDDELDHVIEHVLTEDDGTRVVIRSWWRTKQRWNYQVISLIQWRVGLWRPDGEVA